MQFAPQRHQQSALSMKTLADLGYDVDYLKLSLLFFSFYCRAEKSKNAAKCRRDKEAVEFNNIIDMLPFPNEDLEKIDKSSVVKLTTSYFKMMEFIEKGLSIILSDSPR